MNKEPKEKWLEMMEFLVENEAKYTDEQFAERFSLACKEIPFNIEVTNASINSIITRRVLAHCKKHNQKLTEYDGALPYRHYVIPVSND
jgi:hypothetical protein